MVHPVRSRIAVASFLASLCLAAPAALAQDPPAPPLEGSAATTMPKLLQASASFLLLPVGSFKTEVPGFGTSSTDTAVAFGIAPAFDGRVHERITLGLAIPILFNVKGSSSMSGSSDAAKEIDVLLRATGWLPMNSQVKLFGIVAPGYSVILIPNKASGQDNPSGLVLQFGAGATYDLSDTLFLVGQLGYQIGFQSTSVMGTSIKLSTNYLHLGVGAGMPF